VSVEKIEYPEKLVLFQEFYFEDYRRRINGARETLDFSRM
jgi:hypothetical protein